MYNPVHDYGVIVTSEEAEPILQDIKAHPETWRHITEWYPTMVELEREPLHVLGSPIYRDNTIEMYTKARPLVEPLIQRHAWLRDIVMQQIVNHHPNCNRYEHAPNSSLPGFHVFNTCNGTKNRHYTIPTYHTDTDWINHFGAQPGDRFYSYLVALELPRHGSGLHYKQHMQAPEEARLTYRYERYHMYGWSAQVAHKFADTFFETDDDYRITFQGHGWFRNDGTFYYYW